MILVSVVEREELRRGFGVPASRVLLMPVKAHSLIARRASNPAELVCEEPGDAAPGDAKPRAEAEHQHEDDEREPSALRDIAQCA